MNKMINENSNNIKIEGHRGTWYVIAAGYHEYKPGKKLYVLEHEYYGEDAAALIVTSEKEIILEDVWNGISELDVLV